MKKEKKSKCGDKYAELIAANDWKKADIVLFDRVSTYMLRPRATLAAPEI